MKGTSLLITTRLGESQIALTAFSRHATLGFCHSLTIWRGHNRGVPTPRTRFHLYCHQKFGPLSKTRLWDADRR